MEQPPACPVSRWDLLKQQLDNLDAPAFRRRMAEPDTIVLDVRTREEYAAFHLPNALNLDYLAPEFIDRLETLDPAATYLVYCRSGRRSTRACTLMRNGGFASVYNLAEGLNVWNFD
jgi:rhodanese-related sulfurtransferase